MTQEEEKLLFIEICSRTPYSVIVRNIKLNFDGYAMSPSKYQPLCVLIYDLYGAEDQGFSPIEDIRPYLRPMSSMTEEENEELKYEIELELQALEGKDGHNTVSAAPAAFEIDFYNKHHIDYRGLIEKGLALEAPEGMYD